MWKFSENGIPRLINKICKLSLKAAETSGTKAVDDRIVSGIAERFMRTVKSQRKQAQQKAPPIEEIEKLHEKENEKVEAGAVEKIAPKAQEQSKQAVSVEIKSQEIELKAPAAVPPVAESRQERVDFKMPAGVEKKTLKQLEEIASNLATEKIKASANMSDPFEMWEKARSEILDALLKARQDKTAQG